MYRGCPQVVTPGLLLYPATARGASIVFEVDSEDEEGKEDAGDDEFGGGFGFEAEFGGKKVEVFGG